MEVIEIIILFIVCSAFAYWRGVVSGYRVGYDSNHKSPIFNLEIEEVNGEYMFYDLANNKFLLQDKDQDNGINRIASKMADDVLIVVSRK